MSRLISSLSNNDQEKKELEQIQEQQMIHGTQQQQQQEEEREEQNSQTKTTTPTISKSPPRPSPTPTPVVPTPPLNCYSNINDGFSGWYAFSTNGMTCTDFCFWHVTYDDNDDNDNDENNNDNGKVHYYGPDNTADPHETTRIVFSRKRRRRYAGGKNDNDFDKNLNGISRWVCAYHVDGDDILWNDIVTNTGRLTKMNESFSDLRCSRGAGERLRTISSESMKSVQFWTICLFTVTLMVMIEIWYWFYIGRTILWRTNRWRKLISLEASIAVSEEEEEEEYSSEKEDLIMKNEACDNSNKSPAAWTDSTRKRNRKHDGVAVAADSDGIVASEDDDNFNNPSCVLDSLLVSAPPAKIASVPHSPCCPCPFCPSFSMKKKLKFISDFVTSIAPITIVLCLNGLLMFVAFISIMSLVEITGHVEFDDIAYQRFTPACTDPSNVCDVANHDINLPSHPYIRDQHSDGNYGLELSSSSLLSKTMPSFSSSSSMPQQQDEQQKHFSYIIASDSQLDWFDGEFALMGQRNIPLPCDESDTCTECTAKFGSYSNLRMKNSIEMLLSPPHNTMNSITPKTLVMNGDLTAYYHRNQLKKYEVFYHNLSSSGLEYYFPSLGNHDYDHYNGASYSGDEWQFRGFGLMGGLGSMKRQRRSCNSEHALGYIKSGFCGRVPKFDTKRIVRYDSKSLAYSWEEGPYHFVHTHYYPTYESARLNISSSLSWLENDLNLAFKANLSSILFVHAAQGLDNPAMEKVLLGKKLVAIFAGHTHRCLHRRCEGLVSLNVNEVVALQNLSSSSLRNDDNDNEDEDEIVKCLPATMGVCGGKANANLMSLFRLEDKADDLNLPNVTLKFEPANPDEYDNKLCPKEIPTFVNETDNTLLCRRTKFSPSNFPFRDYIDRFDDSDDDEVVNKTTTKSKSKKMEEEEESESIPIFWSGSASFETLLRADFYNDKLVVNALTAQDGEEGLRYVDVHYDQTKLIKKNAVYPYHDWQDLDEVIIYI